MFNFLILEPYYITAKFVRLLRDIHFHHIFTWPICHYFHSLSSVDFYNSCFVWERFIVLEGTIVWDVLNSWALTCEIQYFTIEVCDMAWPAKPVLYEHTSTQTSWHFTNTSARGQGNVRKHLYMWVWERKKKLLDNEQLLTTHSLLTLGVNLHLNLLSAHSQEVISFVSHVF